MCTPSIYSDHYHFFYFTDNLANVYTCELKDLYIALSTCILYLFLN